MKILIAHNEYKYPGGEDSVVDAEATLLREHGHEVQFYKRSNFELDSISRASAALSTFWSHRTVSDLDALVRQFRPDLIHVHNSFPRISPSIYWGAENNGVPVVQTLHNFRLLCPQAMFLRDGKECQKCVGRMPWPAIRHKCYRDSALQSAVTVGMIGQHRLLGSYRDKVTLYIALNEFGRDKFIQGGLPPEKIRVKPNFVASRPGTEFGQRQGALFIGRLSIEKGLHMLADAVDTLGELDLRIVGEGPLENMARERFGKGYIGIKTNSELMAMLKQCRYLIVPSIGIESFGMVAIEAFACGTPVIASRLGGLGNIVKDGVTGLLVNPGDVQDLAQKIVWAEAHPDEMRQMGRNARTEYEMKYTPQRNHAQLMDIYNEALANRGEIQNCLRTS